MLIFCLLFAITTTIQCRSNPIVKTQYGLIQGTSDNYANMYLGIPFAKPPINNLRWQKPQQAEAWSPSILNATIFKPACAQVNCSSRMPNASCPASVSEDCLYLNVFTPLNMSNAKAVMLFIHGGNFQYQGANSPLIDGRYLASYGDVIVVTLQYRLGALGFLVTGLDVNQIKGNFGIMDQRLAIKWVYENVAAFGGDSSRITLFGQSAGGESVTIHLLSEDMQQYFTNAIIQSSPMAIPLRNFDESTALYVYLSNQLGCQQGDMNCLYNKTYEEIAEAQLEVEKKVTSFRLLGFFEPWLPWVDGDLIKGQLLDISKWNLPKGQALKPFIIGTLTEECHIYIYLTWNQPLGSRLYVELMLASFKQESFTILDNFRPDLNSLDQRDLTARVATDWVFSCGSRNFLEQAVDYAQQIASNNTYYQYVYDFPLDFNGWTPFDFCDGHVCHGSDMPYTFDSADTNFTSAGRLITQTHMSYWTNFAKTSSPNAPFTQPDLVSWPQYDSQKKPYLRFQAPQSVIQNAYNQKDCDVFDSVGYYH